MHTVKILFIAFSLCCLGHCGPACLNQTGHHVDWFLIYKLPRLYNHQNQWVREGVAQAYFDPLSPNSSFSLLQEPINSTSDHPLAYTLNQMYWAQKKDNVTKQDVMLALYNDKTPQHNLTFTKGHSKGLFMFGRSSGFWLPHSLPMFPEGPIMDYASHETAFPNYTFVPNGKWFGQVFLCLSMTYSPAVLDMLAKHLTATNPQVYNHWMPDRFARESPLLAHFLSSQDTFYDMREAESDLVETQFSTSGGVNVTGLAKNKETIRDIYEMVQRKSMFQGGVFVECWRPSLKSICGKRDKVFNLGMIEIDGVHFNNGIDHSKWCIAVDKKKRTGACVCDLNRTCAQEKRSGGCICVHLQNMYSAFFDAAQNFEACDRFV